MGKDIDSYQFDIKVIVPYITPKLFNYLVLDITLSYSIFGFK